MYLSNSKVFAFVTFLVFFASFTRAADLTDPLDAQREVALDRISVLRERASSAFGDLERESAYSELGANLDGYIINGLSRSKEETSEIYREMYNAFVIISEITAIDYGESKSISEIAVALEDVGLLRRFFGPYLEQEKNRNNVYVAKLDYAVGLQYFGFAEEAEELLISAIEMRPREDAFEAMFTYAKLLQSEKRSDEALKVVEDMPQRFGEVFTPAVLYLKKEIIMNMGGDSTEVEAEITRFLEKMEGMGGTRVSHDSLGGISPIEALFGIERAYAADYSHTVNEDDSRGTYANTWWVVNENLSYARWAINGAEVVYNEARGESSTARNAVAWAIRNRAYIDMNGADHYIGSQSDNNVSSCRVPTPIGPQPTTYPLVAKHYSCVIHGRTWAVGATHSQMNDFHRSVNDLQLSNTMGTFLGVVNNYTPDPSYYYYPITKDSGNPNGAQEWLNRNYCAANHENKRRHGNVGGYEYDDGNICPTLQDLNTIGENYFWGRMQ